MSDTAVQRYYRFQSLFYDQTRWMILHGRRRAITELKLQPNSHLLEVGCGSGLNFRYAQEVLDPASGRITGLDFSRDMLNLAQSRITAKGWKNITLLEADATKLDLPDKFDGVLFAYSITMIPGWEEALQRAYEHLRPGGRLVVLDFCTFDGWGPLAPTWRWWFKKNHVLTERPYLDKLKVLFPDLRVIYWLGKYNFTAIGTKRS